MVGTRAVAADAYRSHECAFAVVQRQSAAEDIHPADFLSAHRVVVLSIVFGVAPVGYFGVNRIAVLQAEETSSGLHRSPQIGGGESQARQTESIGRIGLLCGEFGDGARTLDLGGEIGDSSRTRGEFGDAPELGPNRLDKPAILSAAPQTQDRQPQARERKRNRRAARQIPRNELYETKLRWLYIPRYQHVKRRPTHRPAGLKRKNHRQTTSALVRPDLVDRPHLLKPVSGARGPGARRMPGANQATRPASESRSVTGRLETGTPQTATKGFYETKLR